jgi:hypothetical protein
MERHIEVESLGLTVRFDRSFNISEYYPSPGGYEAVLNNGNRIRFDFLDTAGYRVEPEKIRLVAYTPDREYSESVLTKELVEDINVFEEIFIYAGESEDSPVPLEIEDMEFFFNDGSSRRVPETALCRPTAA